ncbi:DNA topoisomerase [Ureibacillus aquaedulcis]|uniref:DNA topoisomerase n=1 Tax=Ureibacillus aquaedulcis TaxID=3058421 RepID=A0ABT8GN17_9BACL|nr:DNA topoisomerase [Ureibacillus sp. BA0131]MDN4492804.1 DNA topoisomerase [Ureibacillus sp. BA0131]
MKALLIAEKPSLMRDIQKVYKKMQLPYEIDFTSFVGHVVELKEPHEYKAEWKKWDLNLLPMIPERYEFRVKKSAYKVYKEIEQVLKTNRYDFIINACDAGMEGENIFYSFYKRVGCKLPVKRFWTSQTTDNAIFKALLNLIDEQDLLIRNLRNAAMYRTIFDWLIGLNLTRAATVKGGRIIKIGRVMTPTLAIVVKRELEVLQFKPEPYFQIELDLGQFKALWFSPKTNENKLKTMEEAQSILSRIGNTATVQDIKTERKTMSAPPLHSLLELQKEANKFFGFTSSETLKIAQSLYEKKLITYPRTESKHLPTSFAQNIKMQLQTLASLNEYGSIVQEVLNRPDAIQRTIRSKKYVDDKKLTDHHAITVTEVAIGKKKLSLQELKIYHLIARRLLAIFMPAYVIDKTAVLLKSNEEFFKANGNMVIDKGYTILYDAFKKKQELPLPPLQLSMQLPIKDAKILSKVTEPPARYTDSTLLDAMFHAGRFIEDKELQKILKDAEGIGTSATRAEIIEKLISIGMIAREGKSFKATQFGIDVIQSIGEHDIVSPELTAIWSKKLKDIVDGQLSSGQFYKEMLAYVKQTTDGFVSLNLNVAEKQMVVVGKCLQCGQAVVEGFKGYSCSNKACKFFISKTIMKGKITPTDAKKLLNGKETREIRFTWKSGKKGKAKLKLVNEKLEFVFPAPTKDK